MTTSHDQGQLTLTAPAGAVSVPLFGSVLGRTRSPRRPVATGAAFAVAAHLWLIVAAVQPGEHEAPRPREPTELTFVSPGPPPPPPLGGNSAQKAAPQTPKPRVDPRTYRDAGKAKKPEPAKEEPIEEPSPDDGEGDPLGEVGGTKGGQVGGQLGSTNLEGIVGATGTGTGRAVAPPPPTFTVIHLGEGTDQSAPVWLTSSAPPYPPEALAAKVSGLVLARCNVYPDGSLRDCKILKSHSFFDAAVLAHLAKARVQPFTSGGKPVNGVVAINIPIRFTLP